MSSRDEVISVILGSSSLIQIKFVKLQLNKIPHLHTNIVVVLESSQTALSLSLISERTAILLNLESVSDRSGLWGLDSGF